MKNGEKDIKIRGNIDPAWAEGEHGDAQSVQSRHLHFFLLLTRKPFFV